jgi:hypothetical protein
MPTWTPQVVLALTRQSVNRPQAPIAVLLVYVSLYDQRGGRVGTIVKAGGSKDNKVLKGACPPPPIASCRPESSLYHAPRLTHKVYVLRGRKVADAVIEAPTVLCSD